jgi:hypothetical protein
MRIITVGELKSPPKRLKVTVFSLALFCVKNAYDCEVANVSLAEFHFGFFLRSVSSGRTFFFKRLLQSSRCGLRTPVLCLLTHKAAPR